jgi:hypothetical protein
MARDRRGIDPHKHESQQDRTRRHQQAAGQHSRPDGRATAFNYKVWDAMHTEAENATLFNPDHRQGRRPGAHRMGGGA